jgi:hypothetical protein
LISTPNGWKRLEDKHIRFVSPGIVALGDGINVAMLRS